MAQARRAGINACAIVLIHAWRYPAHEQRLAELACDAGFTQVSASHAVSPLLRLVPRGDTTVVDAYLSPILRRYVDQVAAELTGTRLYFMQSSGGLTEAGSFQGKDAILSGPAGGIVGAARTAGMAGLDRIIGFDMGGTSTDVALYAGGFERAFETAIAGVRMRAPMMAINTVAAGGGSVLHFDGARMRVGSGFGRRRSRPGLLSARRPADGDRRERVRRQGPGGAFPGDLRPARQRDSWMPTVVTAKFAALANDIAAATGDARTPQQAAEGFLQIAVANMANAIKQVSVQKGHDVSRFALQCFGGAGGQHACLVADALGMETVFIHPYAGVLSAYGMGLADQTAMKEQAVETPLDPGTLPQLAALADRLAADAVAALAQQGADATAVDDRTLVASALCRHRSRADRPLWATWTPCWRISCRPSCPLRLSPRRSGPSWSKRWPPRPSCPARSPPRRRCRRANRRAGGHRPRADLQRRRARETPVLDRTSLLAGDRISGPALVREANATTVIEPGWTAEVTPLDHMILRRTQPLPTRVAAATGRPDPVLLELFNNLFMNVAEQTGAVLQNTAMSVNIKERLDFSCAIFDADGHLVANAPHVPVHLGAMGESVRTVLDHRRGRLNRATSSP